MDAKAITLITSLMIVFQIGVARDPVVILDSRKEQVLEANQLTYYGIDFSKLRLINPAKLTHANKIKNTYCPAWIEVYDGKYSKKVIQKGLSVQILNDRRYPFQSDQIDKNNVGTIVSQISSALNLDSIRLIVNDYHLEESNGIGVSIIMSEFRKYDEKVTGYVTFFEISSKALLYVVKVHGKAGGKGMTTHWYEGMYEVWRDFIGRTYREEKMKDVP